METHKFERFVIILLLFSFSCLFNVAIMTSEKMIAVNFEVFGRVQGVFFRKYTQKKAKELNVKGWCRNTSRDTVEGILEGQAVKVDLMKDWLQRIGSPTSAIDKAVFTNQKTITDLTFKDFTIER